MCYCDHDTATCRSLGHDHAYEKQIADAMPKWFWWHHWGDAIGSDDRYKPRWYERRAYLAGLQDAARIVEKHAWEVVPLNEKHLHGSATRRTVKEGFADMRRGIRAIHAHATRFMRSIYFPEL